MERDSPAHTKLLFSRMEVAHGTLLLYRKDPGNVQDNRQGPRLGSGGVYIGVLKLASSHPVTAQELIQIQHVWAEKIQHIVTCSHHVWLSTKTEKMMYVWLKIPNVRIFRPKDTLYLGKLRNTR